MFPVYANNLLCAVVSAQTPVHSSDPISSSNIYRLVVSSGIRTHLEFRSILDVSDLELGAVLLEHAGIVILSQAAAVSQLVAFPLLPSPDRDVSLSYLPELLRRVLASNALEDLRTAGVLVDEVGHVEDLVVDDDVHARVGGLVVGDVGRGEGLGHGCGGCGRI